MSQTPRFPLCNLSNSKPFFQIANQRNNLNETPYFDNRSKVIIQNHEINEKPFFQDPPKEKKFGESYEFNEPFLKEEFEAFEKLLKDFSEIKIKGLRKNAFSNFIEDYEVDMSFSEEKDSSEYLKEFKELHEIDKYDDKDCLFIEEAPAIISEEYDGFESLA